MSNAADFPDDVPVADVVEQLQDVHTGGDETDLDLDAVPPLESNPADWQEQQAIVEDPEDDERA